MNYRKFFTILFTICFSGISSFGQFFNYNLTGSPDSTVALAQANEHVVNTIIASMCSHHTYYFGTQPITTAGTYIQTFPAANNHDSTVTLHLTVSQNVASIVSLTLCPDQLPFTWNGITIPAEATSNAAFTTYSTFNTIGCDSTVTLNLTISPDKCHSALMMPNAFSPNGDGLNDKFGPGINEHPAQYVMKIYNRVGQTIYTAYKAEHNWDGTYCGQAAASGTYYYTITGKYANGRPIQMKGDVTLIR
jgi:gliding motility-associated-like protein